MKEGYSPGLGFGIRSPVEAPCLHVRPLVMCVSD